MSADTPIIKTFDGRMIPCPMCEFDKSPDIDIVYQNDLWSVYVAPPITVPGWLVLQTRRHALGLVSFTDAEASTLGYMQQAVAKAIHDVCEAERVVEIFFGFSFEHYHTLLAPMTEFPDDLSSIVEPFTQHLPPVSSMFEDGRHKMLYAAVSPSATTDRGAVQALLPGLRRKIEELL